MNLVVTSAVLVNAIIIAATTLDGTTVVPIGPVLGSAATVLMCGMWISRKVTRFEELCVRFSDQQATNIARLDAMDKRLMDLDERIWAIQRNAH